MASLIDGMTPRASGAAECSEVLPCTSVPAGLGLFAVSAGGDIPFLVTMFFWKTTTPCNAHHVLSVDVLARKSSGPKCLGLPESVIVCRLQLVVTSQDSALMRVLGFALIGPRNKDKHVGLQQHSAYLRCGYRAGHPSPDPVRSTIQSWGFPDGPRTRRLFGP